MAKLKLTLTTKGNLLAVSKHADVASKNEDDFALFWYDTPEKGKCLSVEYVKANYPAVTVTIEANWRQRQYIKALRRRGWDEGPF